MDHLQVELVVFIEFSQVVRVDQLSCSLIACADAIVEITCPDNCFVVFDGPIALESQAIGDGAIVLIAFFVVGKASGQMCGHKTD
jgi:hypothetical protein